MMLMMTLTMTTMISTMILFGRGERRCLPRPRRKVESSQLLARRRGVAGTPRYGLHLRSCKAEVVGKIGGQKGGSGGGGGGAAG